MPNPGEQPRSFRRSRHNVVDLLKTMALVVPLTILIWVYAERAQSTQERLLVSFDVYTTNPSQYASVADRDDAPLADTPFTVEVEGSRSAIQQLKPQLDRRLLLELSDTYQAESEPTLSVVALLNSYQPIRQAGVTVTSATPSTVKVRIDARINNRPIPLLLPDDLDLAVASFSITPPSAKVSGPAQAIAKLFPTEKSGLAVDLSSFRERISLPGQHRLEGVPIKPTGIPGVLVTPARVTEVRIEVSAREVEYTLSTVPLVITQPLPTINQWTIELREKTVTNVRVRGPANEIRRLQSQDGKPPEITPAAVLRLTNEDRDRSDVSRAVSIVDLPPNVTLMDAPPTVEFSVRSVSTPN